MGLLKQEIQNCEDPERLLRWAKAKAEYIRNLVAENRHTPPEGLALLAETCEAKSLLSVAKNSSTPPVSLARIVDRIEDK